MLHLTEVTKGFVNYDFLSGMKLTAYLINTSRGAVINEADLYRVLVDKKIAGAGLDVLVKEPPTQENPLVNVKISKRWRLDNV